MGVQYLGANPVSDTAGSLTQYGGTPLGPAAWTTASTQTNSVAIPASTVVVQHVLTLSHYLALSVNTDVAEVLLQISDNAGAYVGVMSTRQVGTGNCSLTLTSKMPVGTARTYRVMAARFTGTGTVQSVADPLFNALQVSVLVVS